ncbi:hypothetical protein FOZ63_025859 [Perkinsus olseni]|uniref:Uncharacterized protein n=1 Tax=Perkinsus olseni TaxID=32597 RepID=A0A7J6U181_PEROL|nr:hypothetical protein FOZ60_011758 [Perkinsus olseni]KAF4699120.1 hypothetical protein FOZ63_001902 [Perkinsus olseni]KAF4745798.1 hypothetical protein FOZ63_025859 [Perkinsus olseni]KAF4750712.1 hypothetical protein FOZ62_026456 [Perkinsus olseni]
MGRSAKATRQTSYEKVKKLRKSREWKKSGSRAIRKEKKEAIRHAKLEEDQVPVIESTDDLPAANNNKADMDM